MDRENDISLPDIREIEIRVPPYAHKLVGHPFELGENPRVNAQFNIHYCVANALLRKNSKLDHFEEPYVKDPKIMEIIKKISVHPTPELEKRGHTALDMRILMSSGGEFVKEIDIAPGFPGNPLRAEDHENHFKDCLEFSKKPISKERIQEILDTVNDMEKLEDANTLISLALL